MGGDNGRKMAARRLDFRASVHAKVEMTRLVIMLNKRHLGEVLEELLEVYHASPYGDLELWEAIKATNNNRPRREIDVE